MLDKSQIDYLYDIFQQADELIQEIKATSCTEVIPAVLQLRYAGWHLLCCLKYDSNNDPQKESEYRSVIEHSERAKFEACRYGIVFCMQAIKAFKESYDKDILSCYEHFISLRDVFDELKSCEADLNEVRRKRHDELVQKQQELEELKKINKKQEYRFWITTALGVVGIIIAIIVG